MRVCKKCGEEKDESEFYPRKNSKDGLNIYCKDCVLAQHRDYHKRRTAAKKALISDTRKDANLRYHYKMTLKEYDQALRDQADQCAICGKSPEEFSRAFAVDHDHETGKVRGILCPDCNRGLGGFHDSLEITEKAVEYLKRNA